MSQLESIDAGFEPDLLKRGLSVARRNILSTWGMPFVGTPAPTHEGQRAALWRGKFSRYGEAPIEFVDVTNPDIESYMNFAIQRAGNQYDAIDELAIFAPPKDFE